MRFYLFTSLEQHIFMSGILHIDEVMSFKVERYGIYELTVILFWS